MKNILILLAVALTSQTSSALTDVHRVDWDGSTLVEERRTENGSAIVLEDGFRVNGADHPIRIARIEIPADQDLDRVTIRTARERDLGAADTITFDHPPSPVDDVDLGTPHGISEGFAYWIIPASNYLGHRIAHVAIDPFREVDGRLHLLATFDLDVTTKASASEAPLRRQVDHPHTTEADLRNLRAVLDAAPLPASDQGRLGVPPEMSTEPLEYVIITEAEQAATYQELADIKTQMGQPAEVVTTEWVLANYAGIDLPARIRAYLRDAYVYRGLRYALLGGDHGEVPIRIVVNKFQAPSGVEISTDKYYACLDGNWNADQDEKMGEAPDTIQGIEGDDADLYAEIYVSRVPSSTPQDATDWINKWKSYTGWEPSTFNWGYQAKFLSLGEVLFPDNWLPSDPPEEIVFDGADLCESTNTYLPPVFSTTRMYQYSDNPDWDPPVLDEELDAVITQINLGHGWIDHVGHGYRTNMSVGDGKLVNKDASEFTNTNKYSVLYAVNCTSGAVRYDCIVERMLLNPAGGIVGGIASTDLDYPSISDNFKFEFFRLLFEEDRTYLSEAFHLADVPWLPIAVLSENSYRWTFFTLISFGDPSLDIWRGLPESFELAYGDHEIGAGTFPVTVTDGGSPVEGAMVCLQKDGDAYAMGVTDASGVASVPFLPSTVGDFTVTVTKNTYIPEHDTATVVAPTSAALKVVDWTIHDGTGGGGTGDANNRADAGETMLVDVSVRNDGAVTATGVSTVFHAGSSYLTVTDSTEASVDIPSGATQVLTAALGFSADATLPDSLRHVPIVSSFDLVSDQGSWSHEWRWSLYQRILDIVDLDWVIPDDDGDGILESGETAEISFAVFNRGEATATDVTATATYGGALFVLTQDTVAFGDILPGEVMMQGPIAMQSTGGSRLNLSVDVTLSDGYGIDLLQRTLDVLAPPTPDTLYSDPSSNSIELVWEPVSSGDVRGYRVYRSDEELGTYVQVSGDIIEDGSFFVDEGLTPLTPYFYRVATVDRSGNEGPWSDPVPATTSPPVLEGFPVPLPAGSSNGSPTFADIDYDARYEIALGWTQPMVFREDGGDFVDGDDDALTSGIFADIGTSNSQFWNSPAVWDIDRDGVNEIIFAAWQEDSGSNGYLYVFDATGAIETGWPREIGKQPWSTPAVGDVDDDERYEIFLSSGAGSGSFQGVLFGFNHNGSDIVDGDSNPSTTGVFYRSPNPNAKFMYNSPALADLDDDGKAEVIHLEKTSHTGPSQSTLWVFDGDGTPMPGFPYGAGSLKGTTSSPAVADINNDGDLEIIAVTEDRIDVVNHTGTSFAGWPKFMPSIPGSGGGIRDFMSSPAIGDLNNDGLPEIVVGWLDGEVYAWTGATGVALPGFPSDIVASGGAFDQYLRSPAIGNLDGDSAPEIVISAGNANIYAVKNNGAVMGGFPLALPGIVYGSCAIWDIDQDGFVNLVVQSNSPSLTVYDFVNVPFVLQEHPWPMFRFNRRKDGRWRPPAVLDGGPPQATVPAAAALHAARPNPFIPRVNLPFDVPAGGAEVKVTVYDVRGRKARVLADGNFPAGQFEISWDGRSSTGQRLAAGTYFARVVIGGTPFVSKLIMLP